MKHNHEELKKLDFNIKLGETIRLLYNVALDHCVLRSLERQKIICVSKDQLVSLLERGYAEKKIEELFELSAKNKFHAMSFNSFQNVEKVNVLVITEDGGSVVSAARAFAHIEYEFPEWWSAPLPLVFLTKDKIILNKTTENLPIAKPLMRINGGSLPLEREDFFVTLDEKNKSRTVMFKRLTRNIHILEDVTSDVETANDIVWWASVGKALSSKIECEGKVLWRDGSDEDATIEETLVCEWDGKNVGTLHIGKKKPKPRGKKK